ncbi:unnamed protein product, partial [Rotaria sp. Silwood1]
MKYLKKHDTSQSPRHAHLSYRPCSYVPNVYQQPYYDG